MQSVLTIQQGGFIMNQRLTVDDVPDTQSETGIDNKPGMVSHHGQAKPNSLQAVTDKAQKLWGTTHVRIGIIGGGVALAGLVYMLAPSTSVAEKKIDGRDGVAAVEITTDAGEVNADQAEYLARKQKEEMQAKAEAGETNAAVLTTPTLISESEVLEGGQGISSETSMSATASSTSDLRIAGEVVENNPRFSKLIIDEGVFYKDLNTNQYYKLSFDGRALEPSAAPGSKPASNMGTQTAPENSMANTQYQPNQTPNTGNTGGDGAGGTGGPTGQEAVVPYDASEDPDIQRYRQGFGNNYDTYMMQNQNASTALDTYRAQMQANQQNLLQQRQALAQGGVTGAISRVNSLSANGSTYGIKNYSISSQGGNAGVNGINGQGGYGSGISSQTGANGLGGNAYGGANGYANGVGGVGVTGNAGEVATNMMNDPMYYNRQATKGLLSGEDPGSFNNNASVSATANGSTDQKLGGSATLPAHIVRAGTNYTVVVTKTVNSDYGNVVEAKVVGGPFSGATVYGQLVPQGRNVGVQFSSLQKKDRRSPVIPLTAKGVAMNGTNGIAHVKNHYVQNYTHMALTSALQGYGDAYANTGTQTTVERSDGTVITTSDGENTRKEVEANIAREFAARLQRDTAHLGNRAPTFIIPAGTVLSMRFSQDWDTTQVGSSIPQ